ncbi:MAG TPA: hypothetical protein P5084_13705 [Paludibacter sp.]|nr:hypothetical protein [Paludibacter sp.]
MKKLITIVAALLINTALFAINPQVPEKMSYQAIVRNNSNALITNHLIGMKISILQSLATGLVVYAETQTPTSNANGLINIAIGTGTVISGAFSTIDWSAGPYFIKTEIDPAGGTAYNITSISELLSVPYAIASKTAYTAKNLTLPFTSNSSYTTTPFSITNSGSSLYTISGISTNGFGIYGETKANNSYGVYGKGTGADFSSGVLGTTGELASEGLPGNVGVQGRSDAHIGVAGTAISGTGGYFSSRTGLALSTKGGIKLTGIGESKGYYLTSDLEGNASWKAPVWIPTGTKIYYNAGYVGIGTTNPSSQLHIKTDVAEIARFESSTSSTSKWIALYQNDTRKGTLWSTNDDIKIRSDAGAVAFQTGGVNTDRIIITADGKTGIGDITPEATLDVEGTVVIGGNGKVFSEIREITGTTPTTGGNISFSYPTGYTMENMRVLSCEINYNGNSWIGLGGSSNNATEISKVFYYLGPSIWIYYPAIANFQNRTYRMMVMKVQ